MSQGSAEDPVPRNFLKRLLWYKKHFYVFLLLYKRLFVHNHKIDDPQHLELRNLRPYSNFLCRIWQIFFVDKSMSIDHDIDRLKRHMLWYTRIILWRLVFIWNVKIELRIKRNYAILRLRGDMPCEKGSQKAR